MDFAIQICSYVVGLPLELLAISAILRSGFRRYPLVFAYALVVFLTTVVEMPTALAYYHDPTNVATRAAMVSHYWRNEGILQITIFATVISLIYSVSSRLAAKRLVRFVLVTGSLLFVGISYMVHYNPDVRPGVWMTPWTRDLKFCSAILDLALWALLIQAKEKNRVLLAVSGGLGIMFAAGAIGEAIRNLSTASKLHWLSNIGGILIVLADMMLLYILWQTFRNGPTAGGTAKTQGIQAKAAR
jgi:hypothetical protein